MAKRVEVTISFDLPSVYRWPDVADRATKLYTFAKEQLSPLTNADIVSVEVTDEDETGELDAEET